MALCLRVLARIRLSPGQRATSQKFRTPLYLNTVVDKRHPFEGIHQKSEEPKFLVFEEVIGLTKSRDSASIAEFIAGIQGKVWRIFYVLQTKRTLNRHFSQSFLFIYLSYVLVTYSHTCFGWEKFVARYRQNPFQLSAAQQNRSLPIGLCYYVAVKLWSPTLLPRWTQPPSLEAGNRDPCVFCKWGSVNLLNESVENRTSKELTAN